MDIGLLLGLIAFIIFLIMLIFSINNDTRKKRERELIEIIEESNNEEPKITLLTELLLIEKSSNTKLNIIMWIMLIPIIINIIMLFITISVTNEIIEKFTSLI